MLVNSFASVLFFILICISVNSQSTLRSYVISKDAFADVKRREFDIFDQSENNLQYFIEAKRNFGEAIDIVASPSKQVVAKLTRKFSFMHYEATISVLDSGSNRWINGTIKRNWRLFGRKYTIEWNGEKILMKTIFGTLSIDFRDEKNKIQLAELHKRVSSVLLPNKYDLNIYSNKIPDAIYLLTIAVHDYQFGRKGR